MAQSAGSGWSRGGRAPCVCGEVLAGREGAVVVMAETGWSPTASFERRAASSACESGSSAGAAGVQAASRDGVLVNALKALRRVLAPDLNLHHIPRCDHNPDHAQSCCAGSRVCFVYTFADTFATGTTAWLHCLPPGPPTLAATAIAVESLHWLHPASYTATSAALAHRPPALDCHVRLECYMHASLTALSGLLQSDANSYVPCACMYTAMGAARLATHWLDNSSFSAADRQRHRHTACIIS